MQLQPSSRCCRRRSTGSNAPARQRRRVTWPARVLLRADRLATDIPRAAQRPGDLQGCRWRQQPGRRDHARRLPGGVAAFCRRRLARAWPATRADGGQGLPQLSTSRCSRCCRRQPRLDHVRQPAARRLRSAAPHHHACFARSLAWRGGLGQEHRDRELTARRRRRDLALLRREARPLTATGNAANGDQCITSDKIFISGGSAPSPTTSCTSCLRPPARCAKAVRGALALPGAQTQPTGGATAIHCDDLEHKMGIQQQRTAGCALRAAEGLAAGRTRRPLAI